MLTSRLAAIGFFVVVAATAVATHAAEHEVAQRDKGFSPESLLVRPGDEVIIKNEDSVVHNILSTSDGLEVNQLQQPGAQMKIVFKATGRWVLRCAIHPGQKLIINVKR